MKTENGDIVLEGGLPVILRGMDLYRNIISQVMSIDLGGYLYAEEVGIPISRMIDQEIPRDGLRDYIKRNLKRIYGEVKVHDIVIREDGGSLEVFCILDVNKNFLEIRL